MQLLKFAIPFLLPDRSTLLEILARSPDRAIAEIAKFNRQQLQQYEDSLKYYWDLKNSLDTKFNEGKIEGLIEGKIKGKIEIAKNLLNTKAEMDFIVAATGLTKAEIEKLKLD